MEREELGARLRHRREARCWSRPEMARQLIRAAHAANDKSMTDVDNLSHNIYRWEKAQSAPANDTGSTTPAPSAPRLPHSAPIRQRPAHWSCRARPAGR
jgi:hypothetical protein